LSSSSAAAIIAHTHDYDADYYNDVYDSPDDEVESKSRTTIKRKKNKTHRPASALHAATATVGTVGTIGGVVGTVGTIGAAVAGGTLGMVAGYFL
jgi:flagellar motor component MotA